MLESIGIQTNVQRLAHIVIHAELDGLICSGPRCGKQLTYALLEERVPKAGKIARKEGLSKLAFTYFSSHGPAQIKDFCWWSGLSVKDAGIAHDSIQSKLQQATLKGKTYWFTTHSRTRSAKSPSAFLLSIYDEYTIAYKDRSDLSDARDIEKMISMGNALTSVILLNDKVAGTWKKTSKKNAFEIRLNPFRKPNAAEREALRCEVVRYGKFLGIPAVPRF